MKLPLELGLDTFGDVTVDEDGKLKPHDAVMRDVVEEAVLADRVGIDFIGLGEHHRTDFAITAPEMLLAAIAARTTGIRLGSAVTVLSSDDPIRVFQRFASLHALSNGRAEIIVGRGSFIESFPLFGFDLKNYERLFSEKLDLLVSLLRSSEVSWRGSIRPPLEAQVVVPAIPPGSIQTWVGVGGSPESVVRAARYRLPLMLAIIGGSPSRFRPYADLYRQALSQAGVDPLPIGVHSPGFVAETDEEARTLFFPHYKDMRDRIGSERGWPPMERAEYEREIDHGSLYVGSPETVVAKIVGTMSALGASRFDLKYSAGTLPHALALRCIELYGTKVLPAVKASLAGTVAG